MKMDVNSVDNDNFLPYLTDQASLTCEQVQEIFGRQL